MEPHPVHPVHPVLEDEDEDEEPPRILLYHGEPHGWAQGSGVRPCCPLAWGHSHTLGGGGRGSRQPRGRWLARQRHVAWPPSRALGTLAACLMGRRPATEPPGWGQSRGRRPHESAWCMGRTRGLGLGELLQACGVAVQSGWLWKASQVLQRGQGRGDLPLSPSGAAPPPRLVRFLLPRARRPLAVPLWRSGRPGSRLPRGGPFSAAGGCVGRWTWL